MNADKAGDSGQDIKIIIATHKKYYMPNDPMYLPLHVGAEGKKDVKGNELELGYVKDNTGENISLLNAGFCELTGLYWAWKNLNANYIGLAHYRRHFGIKRSKQSWENILTYEDIKPFLGKIKVFVPNKRWYLIETIYSHYEHTHYAEQLDKTRVILDERHPEYLNSFDKIMKQKSGYMFNMMIIKQKFLNEYCTWLFDILFELGKRVDVSGLSVYQKRFYGRISEIMWNVWLDYQVVHGNIKKNEIVEFPCIYMEKINWRKKVMAFLKARFFDVKYEGSF